MNAEKIIEDINNKVYYPIYLLMGEEPYFIDMLSKHIEENILNETEKEFNQLIVYGKDTDIQDIIDSAKKYPMMANYQVIIVKEAQHLAQIDKLADYALNPLKSTILVICYKNKKLDKRKNLYKSITKNGIAYQAEQIKDYKLGEWISSYLEKKEYKITASAIQILADNLGNNLSKLENEINKLIINLKGSKEITPELIEKYIGISKDYNIFELQNALGKKDIIKANKIVQYFAKNPKDNPFVLTISLLYSYFLKVITFTQLKDKSQRSVAAALGVNPFFVKQYAEAARNYNINKLVKIISCLREYDVKSKGVSSNVSEANKSLLPELIYKITH